MKNEDLSDELLSKTKLSNDLKKVLDYVFLSTFDVQNIGNSYEECIKTGNFLLKYFVTDRLGIKNKYLK